MSLYTVIVALSLAWALISSITFGYCLIWSLRHPRRKFTPPPPRPPSVPFVGRLHHTLPSVEPTRKIRSQAARREDFDKWLREQDLMANPQITQLQEWRRAHAQAE